MKRLISVSEITTVLDCEAKGDFSYYGHALGGFTIKRRNPAIVLREGRAWGRAVAALHTHGGDLDVALEALRIALDEDAAEQRAASVYVEDDHMAMLAKLQQILGHYAETTEPLALETPEMELRVSLPSRTGKRASSRYVFQGFLDGVTRDSLGLWICEFKLRKALSSLEQIAWSRQIRAYAWAYEQQFGVPVEGVIVDETLNAVPKDARVLKNGQPSHAKDQLCTESAYLRACTDAGVEPARETQQALAVRAWQRRHRIFLRRDELRELGRELVSAGHLIAEMDAGARWPIKNPSRFRCPSCQFRDPCMQGWSSDFDVDFERGTPKRLRGEEAPRGG